MVQKSTVHKKVWKSETQQMRKWRLSGSSFDCYSGVLNVPSSSRFVKAPGVLLTLQTIIITGEHDHGNRMCSAQHLHVIIFNWRSSVSSQSAAWLILSFLRLITGKWILIEEVMVVEYIFRFTAVDVR